MKQIRIQRRHHHVEEEPPAAEPVHEEEGELMEDAGTTLEHIAEAVGEVAVDSM